MVPNRGIQSQFWALKEPKFALFNIDMEIVEEYPEKITKRYKEIIPLICWAFQCDKEERKQPLLVGFPPIGGEYRQRINKVYVKINKHGNAQEMLCVNFSYAFTIERKMSATEMSWLLSILRYGGDMYFDSQQLYDMIRDKSFAEGLVNEA